MFSLIHSFNAIQFVPKKCSKSTTCSLSFILFISDVSDSISQGQRAPDFRRVSCEWKTSILFLAIWKWSSMRVIFLSFANTAQLKKYCPVKLIIQLLACILSISHHFDLIGHHAAKPVLICQFSTKLVYLKLFPIVTFTVISFLIIFLSTICKEQTEKKRLFIK